jgi:hypothetical protein
MLLDKKKKKTETSDSVATIEEEQEEKEDMIDSYELHSQELALAMRARFPRQDSIEKKDVFLLPEIVTAEMALSLVLEVLNHEDGTVLTRDFERWLKQRGSTFSLRTKDLDEWIYLRSNDV